MNLDATMVHDLLLQMEDAGTGVITLTGDGGHAVSVQSFTVHGALPDAQTSVCVWVTFCAHCGPLGVWQDILPAVRHGQDH